jgi:DNA-binding IclR family transcriptional regulator
MTNFERRVLARAVCAHPELLSTDELARRVKASRSEVSSAVHALQRVAMLAPGDRVRPTRAALSYRRLLRA